ncbi:helix-turn-helix domain-containing protein [Mucilaginibacter pedocola]|uniref:AraC family transcriptional regulator n=1 Tax=Mucilaginibacter pedocola TaxID=1792845 RepID=A0A1S9PKL5_9SPHI|nr:helix-turn-helix domain-containing protein [Mucilaginibacter pedocola]OOQ61490.1 AraC family transcriptional regulator [Mucilaginibacter pedocola]
MDGKQSFTLVNPLTGNLAFKLFSFSDNSYFDHIQRNNYYSLIWIKQGEGIVKADFSEYSFMPGMLFAFSPYQPFMISPQDGIYGVALNFHPDFFCIHKHQKEIACNGVLFNNIYDPPFLRLDEATTASLELMLGQIKAEMQNVALAQYELLLSYLKIVLITASRLKARQQTAEGQIITNEVKQPFILKKLKDNIEQHFRTHHTASEYANLLNITPKALAKITKAHFNKTLTDLITERIVIEAKRELYLTNKPVKEIAYELGYTDESYFSRFFKTNADISPQIYRDTVGFNRANISS